MLLLVKTWTMYQKLGPVWSSKWTVNNRELVNNAEKFVHHEFIVSWKYDIQDSLTHPILWYRLYKKKIKK